MLKYSVLVLILIALPVRAWWCTPHMIIAQIAKDNTHPKIVDYLEAKISNFSQMNNFPMSNNMVDIACWADDLKSQGLTAMKEWHFINLPYNPDNLTLPCMEQQNIVYEINQMSETIKRTYGTNLENDWIMMFSVANLIHFYGDIHQPLHDTELYSHQFPNGDKGGTKFHVHVDNTTMKLHFVWDSACRQYMNELQRPLNQHWRNQIKNTSTWLQNTYHFSEQQKKEHNMTTVSLESYNDAVQYAYVNGTLKNDTTLTSEYMNNCLTVANKQITLAGLRLANQLNYLFA